MASDADIVRCAAPWPGPAARLLDALAALGPGTWTTDRICQASGFGIQAGDAFQVLSGLSGTGVCVQALDNDSWLCELAPAELRRLASILAGADHYRRMRISPSLTELAVTLPLSPSYLSQELAPLHDRPGGLLTTTTAFSRLAEAASTRLIVMTPFVDPSGFQWLRRVFEATAPSCERIAVLRDTGRYNAELGVLHADWLQALGIRVYDYHLSHAAASGRLLPIETFHAKVVVADDRLAYVGSANFLFSSEGVSLETGLLIDGAAAVQVSRLAEAVIRVARRL